MQLDVHRNTEGLRLERTCKCHFFPTFLLNQGHLEPAAQDHVQMASGYLQGWGYTVHEDVKTLFEKQWPTLIALQRADYPATFLVWSSIPLLQLKWPNQNDKKK